MSIRRFCWLCIFVFSCSSFVLEAQSTYEVGTLPSINLNKSINQGWAANLKWESRQYFYEGRFSEPAELAPRYVLSDMALQLSRKVGLNNALSGGYLIRLRDRSPAHRAIQQFTIVKKYTGFRLAHRFAADQTFSTDGPPEFRFRYRFTTEIPLNGEEANRQEFYFKINNEYLNAFEADNYDLEIRLVPVLGYKITDNNKLETGLDYRLNSFLDGPSRQRYWWSVGWYLKL